MRNDLFDLASERVEHALGRVQRAWAGRDADTIGRYLDDLDVAVEFWLDTQSGPIEVAGVTPKHPRPSPGRNLDRFRS